MAVDQQCGCRIARKFPVDPFRFQLDLTQHSSVNGLVGLQTVQQLHDMIMDHSRGYVDGAPNADIKAVQQRPYDRRRQYEPPAQGQKIEAFNFRGLAQRQQQYCRNNQVNGTHRYQNEKRTHQ